MLTDLKLAVRQFAKFPGFAAVAILTLAIAIGVNAAIFSLVNSVLLRPAVRHDAERVVCIYTASRDARRQFRQFSYAEYGAMRASHEVFADVAALDFSYVGIGRQETFRRAFAFMASENYFDLMGVKPAAGRFFSPSETRPGAGHRVVVAGYSLWQRGGFAGDFLGSSILINGHPYTIIGVSPEGFSGLTSLIAPEVWLPFGVFAEVTPAFGVRATNDLGDPRNFTVNLVGRMQPGFTIESARSRMPVLAARLAAVQPPDSSAPRELVLTRPFNISPTPGNPEPLRLVGLLLLGMSGIVLLVACLNLANMMLARASGRTSEMAVRRALGATAPRVVRQLCVEGLVLAIAGGILGLLLSTWVIVLLRQFFSSALAEMSFNLTANVQPDVRVVAVTFGFCVLSTLAFSLGPALKASRVNLVQDLKARAGECPVSGRWNRFFSGRHLMVMAQLTLSLALVFAAGVFVRTAIDAGGTGRPTGFDGSRTIVTELDFSLADANRPEAMRRMLAAVERIRQLPGVEAAGLSTFVPYNDSVSVARVVPAESATAANGESAQGVRAIAASITPGYFGSIGVRVVRGREFSDSEARESTATRVCIIDEGMADRLFPRQDALGRQVRVAGGSAAGSRDLVVAGIVSRHAHGFEDKGNPVPGIYVPLGPAYSPTLFLTARTAGRNGAATTQTVAACRKSLRQLDPELPIVRMLPFEDFAEKNFTLWMVRLGAMMFGVFGGVALLLAMVGVYGVKAYAVARRTHEIGIRMAIGASRRDVFALIMRQGALQAAVALAVGVVLCILAGRAVGAVFYQVQSMDLVALGCSAAILCAATVLACILPAHRATEVSPLTALRSE